MIVHHMGDGRRYEMVADNVTPTHPALAMAAAAAKSANVYMAPP